MVNSTHSVDELNLEALDQVAGGAFRPLMAEDSTGNKLTPLDYLDHQLAVFYGAKNGSSPFHFNGEQRELYDTLDPDS